MLYSLLLSSLAVPGAPAPLPRHQPRPMPLSQRLAGDWMMHWGGLRFEVRMCPDGNYRCSAPGVLFVGSWWVDDRGRLLIKESVRPYDQRSWQRYVIRLGRGDLSGKVEVGAPNVEVQFARPGPKEPSSDDEVPLVPPR